MKRILTALAVIGLSFIILTTQSLATPKHIVYALISTGVIKIVEENQTLPDDQLSRKLIERQVKSFMTAMKDNNHITEFNVRIVNVLPGSYQVLIFFAPTDPANPQEDVFTYSGRLGNVEE